jgi:nicotinamide phosphoribosyltransferase
MSAITTVDKPQGNRAMRRLMSRVADLENLLLPTQRNPLVGVDVYKMGHMEQYVPGCNKVFSYLLARSDKHFSETVFFGLQYYLKQYLSRRLEPWMADEFLEHRANILGIENSYDIIDKVHDLCKLGYFPLEIKAVPEGTVMSPRNVLMTITNTHPDFYWVVGFIESLILKVWYSITVASCSFAYRNVVNTAFEKTVTSDMDMLRQFTVHDFGYRGDTSEEGAGLSGVAHLLSFTGSDTVPALPFARKFYGARPDTFVMASVPASEHSVMCSFGTEDELAAFRNMLNLYPTGFVSIVSDTYDVYHVLTEFAEQLKSEILARDGKTVFRPDSGNPEYIICGDPEARVGSNEWKGAIRLLDEAFGSTVNEKGFKVLNPKVGLIYGDGMYLERYQRTLDRLEEMGYAACNLVIGVGGILRNHSRDTLGFALKATYVEVDGVPRDIVKNPVTDSKKKSHKGLVALTRNKEGRYETIDGCTKEEEGASLLQAVFRDGQLLVSQSLEEIRVLVEGDFA